MSRKLLAIASAVILATVVIAVVLVALLSGAGEDGPEQTLRSGDTSDAPGGTEAPERELAVPGSTSAEPNGANDFRRGQPDGSSPLDDARINVSPSTVLLTNAGQRRRLVASSADGTEPEGITWQSSNPGSVAVSDSGEVEALVDVGSAIITVSSGARRSPPVLVHVAEPVPGAVLVDDPQVAGVSPDPLEPAYGIYRYTAILQDIETPEPGAIMIGTGEAPIGGRVIEANRDGDVVEVTLEAVPPGELFRRVEIDQEFDLSYAEMVLSPQIIDQYDVVRTPDGVFEFSPRQNAVHTLGNNARFASYSPQSQTLYLLGPFKCETTFPRLPISLSQPAAFSLETNLSISLLVRDRFEHLILSGKPRASMKVTPVLNVEFSGKVECKVILYELTIPIGGWLAVIFGGQVPMGLGMEMEGKLTLAGAGAELKAEVGADFRIGVECAPETCNMVNEFDPTAEGSAKWIIPGTDQFRFEPTIAGFAFAELEIGSRLTRRYRFDALEVKAGIAQEANLAPVSVQAADDSYASDYQLKLFGEAEAAGGLDEWLELLKLRTLKLKAQISQVIRRSPAGNAASDVSEFKSGDKVVFDVRLDRENLYYPIVGYNIVEVHIYRRNGAQIEKIASITLGDGDESTQLKWTADREGKIGSDFFAFALTKVLPLPDLEIGAITPGALPTPTPEQTATPERPACDVVTRPQGVDPNGNTIHQHLSYPAGLSFSVKFTETDADGELIHAQSVDATVVWDQLISTRLGDFFYSSAFQVDQTITAMNAGELETYSPETRFVSDLFGVPVLGHITPTTWTWGELELGVRIERIGSNTREYHYTGCAWWK